VNGTQHIIVFGDSGSGKTWLYKEHFGANSISFRTVDLSIALTEGVSSALLKALPKKEWRPVRRKVSGDAGVDIYVARVGASGTVEYEHTEVLPLDALLSDLSSQSDGSRFIVFDNFEQISTRPDLLKEIASLIIRLDNTDFASYGVRFLFVGVVADMKELIAHYDQAGTVANRVTEIPEVERLSVSEAEKLVRRGLFDKLRIDAVIDESRLVRRVLFMTDRNAQQLHELCYQIACDAEEHGWKLAEDGLERAERDWVDTSLSHYCAQIESRMNKRETKIQRRNQVLFCLGSSDKESIRANDIDAMIREHFPSTAAAAQLGIDQILAWLADGRNPILIRNPNENSYRLSHPKLKLAIRVGLQQLAPDDPRDSEEENSFLDSLLAALEQAPKMDG